jgi:hypothetical protein
MGLGKTQGLVTLAKPVQQIWWCHVQRGQRIARFHFWHLTQERLIPEDKSTDMILRYEHGGICIGWEQRQTGRTRSEIFDHKEGILVNYRGAVSEGSG